MHSFTASWYIQICNPFSRNSPKGMRRNIICCFFFPINLHIQLLPTLLHLPIYSLTSSSKVATPHWPRGDLCWESPKQWITGEEPVCRNKPWKSVGNGDTFIPSCPLDSRASNFSNHLRQQFRSTWPSKSSKDLSKIQRSCNFPKNEDKEREGTSYVP